MLGKPADGIVTLAELTSFVSNSAYAYVFEKYQGVKQSPDIKGEIETTLPLARPPFGRNSIELPRYGMPPARRFYQEVRAFEASDTKVTIGQYRKFTTVTGYQTVLERRKAGTIQSNHSGPYRFLSGAF
ncbi:hypothetical protein SH661x_002336 [Planctomicrobium sp. SH661]|uniref:hypothetical protein n=1 Tax=Planctomicrobium sp. SH661 TaxID=3448124 RepID=UPI003F5C7C0D